MKKMLFICSRLPYPPVGGDRAKNFNLLKKLSKEFNVHVVVISSEPVSKDADSFLNSVGTYKAFHKTKFDFLKSFMKSFFTFPLPLQVGIYKFSDVQRYIDAIIFDVDVVFTTLVRTTEYVIDSEKPKFCDMADSIGQNYARSYKTVSSFIYKLYYYFESKLLIKYEDKVSRCFDKVFLFNQQELSNFRFRNNLIWIPHGVNEDLLEYPIPVNKEHSIGFLGKMDYQPNIDAVVWFCENIQPSLDPSVKFYIIGANPTERVKALASSNVIVTGFLEDPFEKLGNLKLAVAPMISGGGIQNKVLESLALGVANIVSPLAARPMVGIVEGHVLCVARDVTEWLSLIDQVMSNELERKRYEIEGRNFITDNYTWSSAANIYIDNINSVYRG